LFLHNALL